MLRSSLINVLVCLPGLSVTSLLMAVVAAMALVPMDTAVVAAAAATEEGNLLLVVKRCPDQTSATSHQL